MRQFSVAFFILLPADLKTRFIRVDVVLPLLEMGWERLLVFDTSDERFFDELHIAFAARASADQSLA
jgi:hypothetical protein